MVNNKKGSKQAKAQGVAKANNNNGNARRGDKKKNKSKKQHPKLQPIQFYGTVKTSGLRDGEVKDIESSIQYLKSAKAAVELKLADVPLRTDDNLSSFDILFIEPGFGTSRKTGILCHLLGTTIVFNNPSPFTIVLRAQRPLAYVEDPASIANWEALGKKLVHSIPPKSTLTLGSSNHSTPKLCTREVSAHGERCAHLVSFSAFRDTLSDVGDIDTSKFADQIGLVIQVETYFRVNNGDVGEENTYIIQKYPGAHRLDKIVKGPLVPLRLCDIFVNGNQVSNGRTSVGSDVSTIVLKFYDSNNKAGDPDLDTSLMYRLDQSVVLYSTASKKKMPMNVIKARKMDKGNTEWLIGYIRSDLKFYPGSLSGDGSKVDFDTDLVLPSDSWMRPVGNEITPSRFSSRIRPRLGYFVAATPVSRDEHLYLNSFGLVTLATVVAGVVMVHSILKSVVTFLGAAGILKSSVRKEDAVLM